MINKPYSYMHVTYEYGNRKGNLTAEAVGVVKGKKYFPIFEGDIVFKPLTKSKPFSTPLFAYAEVFWSHIINEYFLEVPQYQLAICHGYEAVEDRYYDYGTVSPMMYQDGEHLINLLEFFRKYPDEKVDIDQYVNYCMLFYDYTVILESDFFKKHPDLAKQLAMQVLISILKGDQNYHYENVAFVCDQNDCILRMAPMIDHEFSTYFMFVDDMKKHIMWLHELHRSIRGDEVKPGEYDAFGEEHQLMEKSAVSLYGNISYIKKNFPDVWEEFSEKLARLKKDMQEAEERFYISSSEGFPDMANSDAYRIGLARYKEKDEEKALNMQQIYGDEGEKIEFTLFSQLVVIEVIKVIELLRGEF